MAATSTPGQPPPLLLLGTPGQRRRYLAWQQATLAVAHQHPTRIAEFVELRSVHGSMLTAWELGAPPPPRVGSGPARIWFSHGRPGRLVRLPIPAGATVHVTLARSLARLAPHTPLLIGGRIDRAGRFHLELVTDLGDFVRALARANTRTAPPPPGQAASAVGIAASQFASDQTPLGSPTQPPAQGVLMTQRVGLPGVDVRGGFTLGDTSGCPYFEAHAEAKVAFGFQWHWPFQFAQSASGLLTVQGLDLPQPQGAGFGVSTPGDDQAYYAGFGASFGVSADVGCHWGFFDGSFSLVGFSASALLENQTTHHAPISGEPALDIPATSCLVWPLSLVPQGLPGFLQGPLGWLAKNAQGAIPFCVDMALHGGLFRSLLHGTGAAADATPQGVALRAGGGAAIDPAVAGGHTITIDTVNYQPTLSVGLRTGLTIGADAASLLDLYHRSQETGGEGGGGSSAGSGETGGGSTGAAGAGNSGKRAACRADATQQLVDTCEIAAFHLQLAFTIPLPISLSMTSPTILGEPVTLTLKLPPAQPVYDPQTIYQNFYGAAPLRERPTSLTLSGDGSLVLKNLAWLSWGGATATAVGLEGRNDCQPDCAAGTYSWKSVRVTLSNPGTCYGRRSYRDYAVDGGPPRNLDFSGSPSETVCSPTPP